MKQKTNLSILLLILSLVLTPALTAGMNTEIDTVILQLTVDDASNLAVNTILEDHPLATVVQDDQSLKSTYILSSKMQTLIIVGHGSQEGILTNDGLISWSQYAEKIETIPANKIVALNCGSNFVNEFIQGEIFTFGGDVDARVGGMIASIVASLFGRNKIDFTYRMRAITELSNKLISGAIKSVPLSLGPNELSGHMAAISLVLALLLLPATSAVSNSLFTAAVGTVIANAAWDLKNALGNTIYYAVDAGDTASLIGMMGQLLSYFALIVTAIFAIAPWYMKIALAAGVAVDSIFTSMATYLKVALVMGGLALFVYDAMNWWNKDDNDVDDYYHYTANGRGL